MFTRYVCAVEDVRDIEAFSRASISIRTRFRCARRRTCGRRSIAVERLAASAKTLLARRVEEAGAVAASAAHRSAEEAMAADSGTSISAAKNALATSKRVRKLPKTANAMRKGELSPAKAEAIADAADRGAGSRRRAARGRGEGAAARSARPVPEGEGQGRGRDLQADPPQPVRAGVQGRAKGPGTSAPAGPSTTAPGS